MLEEMRIIGLGVIDDAVLELGAGLTVVTGETGAGKTMVVSGLGLLFGGRADVGLIRPGAPRAVVEGRLVIAAGSPALARAADAGADLDDDALLVTRTVSAEGRSRAHLGGRSVPVSVLADVAEELVAVHGQAEQLRLLRPGAQRAALDRFAGVAVSVPLATLQAAHARWSAVQGEIELLTTTAQERAREADLLRFGLSEIDAAGPQPGEDAALATEVQRLANADTLRTGAAAAHAVLAGDPVAAGPDEADALGLMATARRTLETAGAHDPQLAGLATRVAEVGYALADVAADLASYAEGVEADPVRLAVAQERQSVLGALLRRYGPDVQAVLRWAADARTRLSELGDDGDRLAALGAERDELLARLAIAAEEVSAARLAAAERFGAAVSTELAALAMPQASLTAAVTTRTGRVAGGAAVQRAGQTLACTADGVDEVELRLAAHPGAPARPLQRGASGGELSRVMLAVEVVFAGADPVSTMVFDEVDAGVGGRAAVEVGRRLARLSRTCQVLVVTHLPQVAAYADRHLLVAKDVDGAVTRSGVTVLTDSDRVTELSRMLAGVEDSSMARGHAEELLVAARREAAAPNAGPGCLVSPPRARGGRRGGPVG